MTTTTTTPTTTRFAAVIPVIDEADAIGQVVEAVRIAGACCVLVVDGGSRDATRQVAGAAGAIVIDEPRRGYGRACLTGAAAAISESPHRHDAVAFLDGDGSCAGEDTRRLVDALAATDVALGRRTASRIEPGAMPWHARFGNMLVAMVLSARTGRRVHDLPPAKAIRADALERLRLDATGYGWTVQFVARALAEPTIRISEVPVAFFRRRGGVSKVSGSLRASVAAGLAMIRGSVVATRPRPVIALMAKAPGRGHAKTRLAVHLGQERTAELWSAMLADAASNAADAATETDSVTVTMLPRREDVAPVRSIVGAGWVPIVQTGSGLANALQEVALAAFDRGAGVAIAVAGDAPTLPSGHLTEAVAALRGRPGTAVIAPSTDGGYNLVGLSWKGSPKWVPTYARRRRRGLLARRLEVAFGSPVGGSLGGASALEATELALGLAGWTVIRLGVSSDLDTIADLRAFLGDSARTGTLAARTAAWIERHRALIAAADDGRKVPPEVPHPGETTKLRSLIG